MWSKEPKNPGWSSSPSDTSSSSSSNVAFGEGPRSAAAWSHLSVRSWSTAAVHVLTLLASAHLAALPPAPGELQPFPPVFCWEALGVDLFSSYFLGSGLVKRHQLHPFGSLPDDKTRLICVSLVLSAWLFHPPFARGSFWWIRGGIKGEFLRLPSVNNDATVMWALGSVPWSSHPLPSVPAFVVVVVV